MRISKDWRGYVPKREDCDNPAEWYGTMAGLATAIEICRDVQKEDKGPQSVAARTEKIVRAMKRSE